MRAGTFGLGLCISGQATPNAVQLLPEAGGTNLLIVDDEEQIREFESRVLSHKGYVCTRAASAEEAWAHLRRRDFPLALIDINLPGESGMELAARILGQRQDVAVLMVTGIDDLSVAREALEI